MSASLQPPPLVNHSDFYNDHGHIPIALLQQDSGHVDSSSSIPTRTVAIIKTHALEQRLEIEPRILEANFEVSVQFQGLCKPNMLLNVFPGDGAARVSSPIRVAWRIRHQ